MPGKDPYSRVSGVLSVTRDGREERHRYRYGGSDRGLAPGRRDPVVTGVVTSGSRLLVGVDGNKDGTPSGSKSPFTPGVYVVGPDSGLELSCTVPSTVYYDPVPPVHPSRLNPVSTHTPSEVPLVYLPRDPV